MAWGTIYIPAYNCEDYVSNTIGSLARQTNQDFDILFVDDASTDMTAGMARRLLEEFFPNRHRLIESQVNAGKAANAFNNLRDVTSDYIAIIDGDDCLIDDEIIGIFSLEYENNYDVVYSNYITSDGRKGHCSPLSPTVCPRKQSWRTSHFFSFRASLIRNVPSRYFQDDSGKWFRSACDHAIAFPILDQTRRYKFIERYAYRYTSNRLTSHHNIDGLTESLSSPQQRENATKIIGYPALPCRNALEGSGRPYEALVVARLAHLENRLAVYQSHQQVHERELSRISLTQLALQERIPLSWLRHTDGRPPQYQTYAYIAEKLASIDSPSVLVFGAGPGTKILHQLVRNRGGRCVTVEHDGNRHAQTSRELAKTNLYFDGSVICAELIDVSVFGIKTHFYDMSWLSAEARFDLVIVDGPAVGLTTTGKLALLPSVAKYLVPNFGLILTDYNLDSGRKIAQVWRNVGIELNYEELQFSQQSVCVMSPV